ncbi:MAG TPA: tRNA (adenine-N1)-methyltransferase [Moorella mulderi]|nr:tRNA (adenine-N1)-methyltransferase [Moorella mulderi]
MPLGPVLLKFPDGTSLLLTLKPESHGHHGSHHGVISLEELKEAPYGVVLHSSTGRPFRVLRPTLEDLMMRVKRRTQIVYPKDAGFILLKLGLKDGDLVFEAGTGSGAMTIALAWAVAPGGRVITYERVEEFHLLAQENVEKAGYSPWVEFVHKDAGEGIEGGPFDAAFIDLRDPPEILQPLAQVLRRGAPVAFFLPTANQVQELLRALQGHYEDEEVVEIFHRYYKTNAERFRPEDRMTAHTGYLVFARRKIV